MRCLIASIFVVLFLANLATSVSIKCQHDLPLGFLPEEDRKNSSFIEILHSILDIHPSKVQFTKTELDYQTKIISSKLHPFVNAVHLAYANHLNLILTPDVIWYLILSGTSIHIDVNSEELRANFVEHEEKKTINIRRDYFIFNSTENQWDGLIDEFVQNVNSNLKPSAQNLLSANFTTTNRVTSACSKIVFLAAFQKYFNYKLTTLCGIPEIKISGSIDDWKLIKSKISDLNSTMPSLSVWYNQLDKLAQKFVDAFENKIDEEFWNQIYKMNGGSGGPFISGWILSLFPYLKRNTRNYFVWEKDWSFSYDMDMLGGLVTSDFPLTLSNSSFIWDYYSTEYSMSFTGGMIGVKFFEKKLLINNIKN
ncbi:conserved domain [Brachionus plicatilis]|uniref:Conserved domain n=1 Tax=Brachionus plicatilis TaxID=10195 RepID=A0A3M7TAA8_BRAPC|nr:conserved domain [Brachionus plicatilis]